MIADLTRYNAQHIIKSYDARDIVRSILGQPAKVRRKYDKYFADHRTDGRKPGLTVYADGIKDYGGDGRYWTIIDFVMDRLGLDYKSACDYITGNSDIVPEPREQLQHNPAEPPSEAWQKAVTPFIEQWHDNLWLAEDKLNYLRNRGLSDETIKRFKLGYNPDWMNIRCEGELLKVAPGITIAWFADGDLYAVRVRTFEDYLDKYMSVSGSKPSAGLFNADSITAGHETTITEGEFDCMLAFQNGVTCVTRGSAGDHRNIGKKWLDKLSSAKIVYGLLDNDKPGQDATEALFHQLDNFVPLPLPDGKDLTDYVKSGGHVADIYADTTAAIASAEDRRAPVSEPTQSETIPTLEQIHSEPLFDERGLPDSFLSAITLAMDGRSPIAMVASELITACVKGFLPAVGDNHGVSKTELAQHIGVSYKSFTRENGILDNLLKLNLVNPLIPNSSEHIGINAFLKFQINLNRFDLATTLCQAIDNRLFEHHFKSIPAPLTDRAILQINGDKSVYDEFETTYQDVYDTPQNKAKLRQLETDMKGDGRWQGWRNLLYEPSLDTFSFTPETLPCDVSEWRTAYLLKLYKIDPELGNENWQRHLGTLSYGTFYNTLERAGLTTDENFKSVRYAISDSIRKTPLQARKYVAEQMKHASKEHRGRVIECRVYVTSQAKPIIVSTFGRDENGKLRLWDVIDNYENELTAIELKVQSASTVRELTADEIATKQAKAESAKSDVTPVTDEPAQDEPEELLPDDTEKEPAEDYPITDYNPRWLRSNIAQFYRDIVGDEPPDGSNELGMLRQALIIYKNLSAEDRAGLRDAIQYQYSRHQYT